MLEPEKKRFVAIVASVGFTGLFVFQVLLAAGLPLGRAAFGGTSATLSSELRIASAVSALLCLGAIWSMLARAGMCFTGKRARGIARWTIRGYTVLFGLSTLANISANCFAD